LERKYNRHYCTLLDVFKKSEFSFHFHRKTVLVNVALPKVTLDDLVLPDQASASDLLDKYKELKLESLMPRLEAESKTTTDSST
jgi:hypothetical protein